MADTGFLKARCKKTGRYMGFEVQKLGSKWKIVNAIDIAEDQARLAASNVEQGSFETNDNLIACQTCGSRRLGGCSCSKKKHACSKGMKYRFDCTYCNELEPDYTLPSPEEGDGSTGKKLVLSQGQEVEIRYADNRPLTEIRVGVGWDPAEDITTSSIDVDSSVVVISPNGRDRDLVYFGNKEHPSGCVMHHGDNLTGEGDIQDGDDENISVYLNKVPGNRDKLVFVLNVYNCDDRRQTLDIIRNLYITLSDPISKKPLIEYRMNGNTGRDTAMVIGVAFRSKGGWRFKAIGRSLRVSTVSELAEECDRYL